MHRPAKAPYFNEVKNRNCQLLTPYSNNPQIFPPHVFLQPGQQPIKGKFVSKKNEIHSDSYKRSFNLQANNIQNKNVHIALKTSNLFQNCSANNEQNSSSDYLNNKYNPIFHTKKCVTSKSYFQEKQNYKSFNKVIIGTKNSRYKKCEKTQEQQELPNEIPNNLVESICLDADQKSGEGPVLCNTPLSDNKLNFEKVVQSKDSKNEECVGENVEDCENISTREIREKTPMCLVNDLARFNKIPFQYHLTSEHGPAHCKTFTVTLKLGDEEYTAEGFKIKKAQHLAAKEAIEKTKYKHPIPKTNRRSDNEVTKSNITPTVELNALAMKLGQQTYYIMDHKQMVFTENDINSGACRMSELIPNCNQNRKSFGTNESRSSKLQQSIHTNKFNNLITLGPSYVPNSSPCKITLIVGNQKFFGVGKSPQQAKHAAATNALQVLKNQITCNKTETQSSDENQHKSPISLVFEIGIKRNLPVDFKVLREEGPAHMRTFTTACIVGNILTEGEGTGKKLSKKRAAEKMLEELKKLPPISSDTSQIKRTKTKTSSKKVGAFSTDCKKNKKKIVADTDLSDPIKKVLELHQNGKEPVFKLISETKKDSGRRLFVMEINGVRGTGNSKKLAKLDAAQNFLDAFNRNVEDLPSKNETVTGIQSECRSYEPCATQEQEKSNLSSDEKTIAVNGKEKNEKAKSGNSAGKSSDCAVDKNHSKSTKAKNTTLKSSALHMKDQLLYLANLLGFEVDFSDYPKGNHNEFLTIVMLSTNPPQISHGVGVNSMESQEDASRNALKILSEMGLNSTANL